MFYFGSTFFGQYAPETGSAPEPVPNRAGGGGQLLPDLPYSRRRVLPTGRKARPARARVTPARPPAPAKRRKAKPPAKIAPEVVEPILPIGPATLAGAGLGDLPGAALPLAVALARDTGQLLPGKAGATGRVALGVDDLLAGWRAEAMPAGTAQQVEPAPLPPHLRWPDDEAVCLAAALLL